MKRSLYIYPNAAYRGFRTTCGLSPVCSLGHNIRKLFLRQTWQRSACAVSRDYERWESMSNGNFYIVRVMKQTGNPSLWCEPKCTVVFILERSRSAILVSHSPSTHNKLFNDTKLAHIPYGGAERFSRHYDILVHA